LPDRIANGNFSAAQRAANATHQPYFNTAAFVCPGGSTIGGAANTLSAGCPLSTPANVGRFGNSSPDLIQTPGTNSWAMDAEKEFSFLRVHQEQTRLQFAAQFANAFNHPNWGSPGTNLSSPASVGVITGTNSLARGPWSFGRRKIALQLKLMF
jgi:hypothetical protein